MSNEVVDDIVRTFGTLRDLATGKKTLDDIGEEACTDQTGDTVEVCGSPACALAKGHTGPHRAVAALSAAPK